MFVFLLLWWMTLLLQNPQSPCWQVLTTKDAMAVYTPANLTSLSKSSLSADLPLLTSSLHAYWLLTFLKIFLNLQGTSPWLLMCMHLLCVLVNTILYFHVNSSLPGPCLLVLLVPQLTRRRKFHQLVLTRRPDVLCFFPWTSHPLTAPLDLLVSC